MTKRASDVFPNEDGFTLIELLVAVVLSALLIVVVGFSVTESLRNDTSSHKAIERSAVGNVAVQLLRDRCRE